MPGLAAVAAGVVVDLLLAVATPGATLARAAMVEEGNC
jgi:hypothetical protein